jgi:hypothetical protein
MLDLFGVTEDNWRDAYTTVPGFAISESPTYVARGVAALAADPDVARHGGQILMARQLADTYGVDGSRPDCLGPDRRTRHRWRPGRHRPVPVIRVQEAKKAGTEPATSELRATAATQSLPAITVARAGPNVAVSPALTRLASSI